MKTELVLVNKVMEFLNINPQTLIFLTQLIKHSISVKKTSFLKTQFQSEFEFLQTFALVSTINEEYFEIEYNSLIVGEVLLKISEEILSEVAPNEPARCLDFANRFGEEIRKPNLRLLWCSDLQKGLEMYLFVRLNHLFDIDITSFVSSVTEEMKYNDPNLRIVEIVYSRTLPYLKDNTERTFDTVKRMFSNDKKQIAGNILQELGEINPIKASELYEYAKLNNAIEFDGFLPNLLIGLYGTGNKHYYLKEAIELFNLDPLQCLIALTWIKYHDAESIKTAYEFITNKPINEIEFSRAAPTFYIRLIENKQTAQEIVTECFKQIVSYSKIEDDVLRTNLIWRTGMIKGYDEEKYKLLPCFMNWGNIHYVKNYFDYFDSPSYLFAFIRQSYIAVGMSADVSLFNNSFSYHFHKHKDEFEIELLEMLTDDLAIVRFGGIQILRNNGHPYMIDFLKLDEECQLRVIDTLLPIPTNIEDLLPLIFDLRKSSFKTVKAHFELELIKLIQAYDHNLIQLVKKQLDETVEEDIQLLQSLNTAYHIYKETTDLKSRLKELNPYENELQYVELYFRLEREKQAEMMEQFQSSGFLSDFGKKLSVIRGGSFNTEDNPVISVMGHVSASMLIDQRYFINPDKYEWAFRMNNIAKNYE